MNYLPWIAGGAAAVGLAARGQRNREQLPRYVTAYHGGHKLRGGAFRDQYFGWGEGFDRPPLGPGYYFHTDPRIAQRYCKYARDPYLYTVEIGPTDKLLNNLSDARVRQAVDALNRDFPRRFPGQRPYDAGALLRLGNIIEEEQGDYKGPSREDMLNPDSPWRRAPDYEAQERLIAKRWRAYKVQRRNTYRVDLTPQQAARRWLIKHGVWGAYSRLPTGWEIAIFNPRLIRRISGEPCR